jgi:hypothetical protein
VVQAWVDGLAEAVKFCLSNFDTAVDNFLTEVPQMKMTATGATHARYGAGFFLATLLKPEMRQQGIGWASHESLNNQANLVMEFIASKESKRPAIDKVFTNEMVGKLRLTDAEWAKAQELAKPYDDILNFKG